MADMRAIARRPVESLDTLGQQLKFYVTAIAWTPRAIAATRRRSSASSPR